MQIAIRKSETLDNKPLVSIWFGDRQVVLKQGEFQELKENISLFELDNKETAPEVPVQEQLKNKLLKLINADFSKSNLNIKIYYLD